MACAPVVCPLCQRTVEHSQRAYVMTEATDGITVVTILDRTCALLTALFELYREEEANAPWPGGLPVVPPTLSPRGSLGRPTGHRQAIRSRGQPSTHPVAAPERSLRRVGRVLSVPGSGYPWREHSGTTATAKLSRVLSEQELQQHNRRPASVAERQTRRV
jgi:hypothetical protein